MTRSREAVKAHRRAAADIAPADARLLPRRSPNATWLICVAASSSPRRHSRTATTRHPEFEIARWSATNLTAEERRSATVYTSGQHCPMCSAAHACMELGRIVYAVSTAQLMQWRTEWGVPPPRVAPLPIEVVAPGVPTT